VLAIHFDSSGKAYPSERVLAEKSVLTERAVRTHLNIAVREGWIRRKWNGKGKGWRNYVYTLAIPSLGAESHSGATLQHCPEGGSGASPIAAETDAVAAEGDSRAAEPDDKLERNVVPPNNVLNNSENIKGNTSSVVTQGRTIEERAAAVGIEPDPRGKRALFIARVVSEEARRKGRAP